MTTIKNATWTRYNANDRGKDVWDCVKRAISMAFDIPYADVSKLLLQKQKALHKTKWNIVPVFEEVIHDLGGSHPQVYSEELRVDELIDEEDPHGVYLILCGSRPGSPEHLTVSVQGKLIDSWDCLDWYVVKCYTVEGVSHQFTNLNDELRNLRDEGEAYMEELATKLISKYKLEPCTFDCYEDRIVAKDYRIIYPITYYDEYFRKKYKLAVVFSPTTSIDAARTKLMSTIKQRLETFFYNISVDVKSEKAGYDLFYESGYTDEDDTVLHLDSRETRFFHSLPSEIKPFVEYINIQSPGQYSDSYQVSAKRIIGDPDLDSETYIIFEGYDSNQIKEEIKWYLKDRSEPGRDYDPGEEFFNLRRML